jgi:hypothetical protein
MEGHRVLLHLMAGSKEDAETVTAFFEGHVRIQAGWNFRKAHHHAAEVVAGTHQSLVVQPPIPSPGMAGEPESFFGLSATIASVVTSKPAASLAKQQQHNHNQKGLPL